MRNIKTKIWLFCTFAFIAAFGYLYLTLPKGISSKPAMNYNGYIALKDEAGYLQSNPDWKYETLGQTNETIGSVGCTISSVAMALKNLGFDFTPKTLNTALTKENSYTDNAWLLWSGIEKVTEGKAVATYYEKPSHKIIDHCLSNSQYPIVKFTLGYTFPHWVIITKRTPVEYYVRDPLVDKQNAIKLSSRTSRILAVRCIGLAKI